MTDFEGHANLEIAQSGSKYTQWTYEQILPMLKGDILEVGSGIGTYSKNMINDFPESMITLSEISSSYIADLKKFVSKNVSISKLDLNIKEDYENIGYEKFDSIIAINVLEHVENDNFALEHIFKMLKKNGQACILVPSHKFLYNTIDANIGHFRRYTKKELRNKIEKTDFKIVKMYYFNPLGILGWYLNGTIWKDKKINDTLWKTYDKVLPISKIIDLLLSKTCGVSLICYLQK